MTDPRGSRRSLRALCVLSAMALGVLFLPGVASADLPGDLDDVVNDVDNVVDGVTGGSGGGSGGGGGGGSGGGSGGDGGSSGGGSSSGSSGGSSSGSSGGSTGGSSGGSAPEWVGTDTSVTKTLRPGGAKARRGRVRTADRAAAEGSVADLQIAGFDILTLSRTRSGSDGSGNPSADAELLSVAGVEVIGAHAEGNGRSEAGLDALCAESDGTLCLALLYASAASGTGADDSSSASKTALASLCAGGTQSTPSRTCDGPLGLGVAQSESSTSSSSSEQASDAVDLCVGGEGANDSCDGLGATVLHSESRSGEDSGSSSYVAGLQTAGESNTLGNQERNESEGQAATVTAGEGDPLADLVLGDTSAAGSAGAPSGGTGGDGDVVGFAQGSVVDAGIGGQDGLTISGSDSEIRDDGSASGDAVVLAVLDNELIAAHSDSNGSAEVAAAEALCDETGGEACLAVLWGATSSQSSPASSGSSSDTGVAYLCLGGDSSQPGADCAGPLSVAVAESHSSVSEQHGSGAMAADHESDGADVCLGGEAQGGACSGLGLVILHAEGHSETDGDDPGTSTGSSYVAGIELGGESNQVGSDPVVFPPGCPDDGSAACVVLNDNDTGVTGQGSGGAVETIGAVILPGSGGDDPLIDGSVVSGSSGVSADEGDDGGGGGGGGDDDSDGGGGSGGGGGGAGDDGAGAGDGSAAAGAGQGEASGLARTGVLFLTLGVLMLALMVIGVGVLTQERRRRTPA